VPEEQLRTRSKAYARIAQLVKEMGPLEKLSIAESNGEVGAQLAEAVQPIYEGKIEHYKLGGVLGAHTGPGTVAVSAVIGE
jgi:fatty acid-binding protein DegV